MDNKLTFITGKNAGLVQLYLPHVLESHHSLIEFPENGRHPQELWDYVIPKIAEQDQAVVITMSEKLLNLLGVAVYEGYLDRRRVKIHVVKERADVVTVEIDESGYFSEGWPFTFLQADTSNKPELISDEPTNQS
jgi:predicted ATPase